MDEVVVVGEVIVLIVQKLNVTIVENIDIMQRIVTSYKPSITMFYT